MHPALEVLEQLGAAATPDPALHARATERLPVPIRDALLAADARALAVALGGRAFMACSVATPSPDNAPDECPDEQPVNPDEEPEEPTSSVA